MESMFQNALVFNQPLSWDISRVTDMRWMFAVPCSPRPVPPNLQSLALLPARCVCTARSHPVYTPAGGGSRVASQNTPHALLATRQGNSLSAANKLFIRRAWAGNPAFRNQL